MKHESGKLNYVLSFPTIVEIQSHFLWFLCDEMYIIIVSKRIYIQRVHNNRCLIEVFIVRVSRGNAARDEWITCTSAQWPFHSIVDQSKQITDFDIRYSFRYNFLGSCSKIAIDCWTYFIIAEIRQWSLCNISTLKTFSLKL